MSLRTGLGQFFFTKNTADQLVLRLDKYQNPCCLSTPRLAQVWMERGRVVTVLDIDRRCNFLPEYRHFDLLNPAQQNETFDVIIMDPYFFSPEKLREAVDCLAQGHQQKLLIVYKTSKEEELLQVFKDYKLESTGHHPSHTMVSELGRKEFSYFANFELFPGN